MLRKHRRSFVPAWIVVPPLAFIALAPATAMAQDASSAAAAQALFEQARTLMAQGKYSEACPKFAESQRLNPAAGTLLNLGGCYEKNGQTASAWVTYKSAEAAANARHRDDWAQNAHERAVGLESGLSKLTIDVPNDSRAPSLEVRRDGVVVGAPEWGAPIPIHPGDHTIEVAAPAKKRWSTKVSVRPNGDIAHVVVPSLEEDLSAKSAAVSNPSSEAKSQPPPEPDETIPSRRGSTQRTAALVIAGVGVAGVVVGGIFGGIAISDNSNAKSLCPTSPGCSSQAGVQSNNDAKNAATISTIGVVAGAALVAAGVVIYIVAPKRKTSSSASLHVGPSVGRGEVGFGLGGAW